MKSSLLFFFSGWKGEEGRRERDAVNVHLSCAISHSNASKLDAVLVDQCFTVFGGEKRREERERREEKREKREREKRKERIERKKREKTHTTTRHTTPHHTTTHHHTTHTTQHTTQRMLGYVLVRQPTAILRRKR